MCRRTNYVLDGQQHHRLLEFIHRKNNLQLRILVQWLPIHRHEQENYIPTLLRKIIEMEQEAYASIERVLHYHTRPWVLQKNIQNANNLNEGNYAPWSKGDQEREHAAASPVLFLAARS